MKIKKKSLLLIIVIFFIAINVSSASPLDGNRTITVMSRNLYIGTDLGPIINAQNQNTLFEAIMTRFAEVQATNFPARAQALADEIAVKKPDIIGLQEVVLIRSQSPAATIEFDFLQILLDELAKRGQHYDIVAISNGFNLEAPVLLPDGSCCQNIQITDREVILARKDMETSDIKLSNIQERNFTNNLIVPILDHQFTVLYGWASVDVEVQGKSFRFITTHLESTSSAVQVVQANELLQDLANTTLPVVLVCDCNSNADGTGTDTYGNLITAGFIDAWSQTHPANPGFTCCQDSNLLNSDSNLSERIDLVLFRGSLNAIESDIVGENTSDRIVSPSGLLWPSDHAGIVAKLSLPVTQPENVTFALRMIKKESLLPGESTNITVDINSNMSQALSLHEIIPAGWNLTRISDDADAFKNSTSESIWFNVSPGINKTVIYRLTAPDNASIGTYHINGTISSASGVIAVVQGGNTITLDIGAFYRRLGSDTDRVETTDVLTAAQDWRNNIAPAGFERAINKQELFVLIDEWIGVPIVTPTPVPTPTPSWTYVVTPGITPYLLVKVGTIPYYIELIKTGSGRIEEPKIPADPNLKVVFYVDDVLYRTDTIARYCLFGGDICAPGKLPTNGEHVIDAKIYNKTTDVWLDTQSMIINQ